MSEIRSQATPARGNQEGLAGSISGFGKSFLGEFEEVDMQSLTGPFDKMADYLADHLIGDLGWSKPRTVKFSELGSLPNGVVVRNNEGGTIAVRESEKDWFIPGLDYEIELWELENPEGEDFTVLFTPGDAG